MQQCLLSSAKPFTTSCAAVRDEHLRHVNAQKGCAPHRVALEFHNRLLRMCVFFFFHNNQLLCSPLHSCVLHRQLRWWDLPAGQGPGQHSRQQRLLRQEHQAGRVRPAGNRNRRARYRQVKVYLKDFCADFCAESCTMKRRSFFFVLPVYRMALVLLGNIWSGPLLLIISSLWPGAEAASL